MGITWHNVCSSMLKFYHVIQVKLYQLVYKKMSTLLLTYLQSVFQWQRSRSISKSFAHKMAVKTSWHTYGTKLRHCHLLLNAEGVTCPSTPELATPMSSASNRHGAKQRGALLYIIVSVRYQQKNPTAHFTYMPPEASKSCGSRSVANAVQHFSRKPARDLLSVLPPVPRQACFDAGRIRFQ